MCEVFYSPLPQAGACCFLIGTMLFGILAVIGAIWSERNSNKLKPS